MEDQVKDAIITGSGDLILSLLIELTLRNVQEGVPIFNNALDEPVFWRRYFRQWVQEGINELEIVQMNEQGNPPDK